MYIYICTIYMCVYIYIYCMHVYIYICVYAHEYIYIYYAYNDLFQIISQISSVPSPWSTPATRPNLVATVGENALDFGV